VSSPILEAMLRGLGGPTRSVFISYHHDRDQGYYDAFAAAFDATYKCIADSSVDRIIDSDDPEYVMRRIREGYITGTSCTIVLCGPETRWRKYVDWEIKATLDKEHGLIGVLLPNNPPVAGGVHKPDRLQDNTDSGYAILDGWAAITAGGPAYLKTLVERAIAMPKVLIANWRPLRQRNG
jgi:hypothetical protein